MNEQEKYRYFQQFNRTMYVIGRVTLIVSLILLVSIPFWWESSMMPCPMGRDFYLVL